MSFLSVIILAGRTGVFSVWNECDVLRLEKMAGGKLEGALRKLTSNPPKVCCLVWASQARFSLLLH